MRFPGVIAPISGLMGHKPSSRGCAFQAVKQDGSALQLIAEVSPWPVCDIFFGRIRKDPVDDLVVNQIWYFATLAWNRSLGILGNNSCHGVFTADFWGHNGYVACRRC